MLVEDSTIYCGRCGRECPVEKITTEMIDGDLVRVTALGKCECGEYLGIIHNYSFKSWEYLSRKKAKEILEKG